MRAWLREYLPGGTQLPPEEHARRVRLINVVLCVIVPVLFIVGLARGYAPHHLLIDIGAPVALPALVSLNLRNRRARSVGVSFALMSSAGIFVHLTGGMIEAHFMYFVLIPLIALYQDWVPFVVAIACVLANHSLLGWLTPMNVYSHAEGQHRPWLWALIHTAFLLALIVVMLIFWNSAERRQRTLSTTLDELRSTQTQLVQAQKLESIGQLAAGIAHEINTPIQFVGDNIRFLGSGMDELFLVVRSFDELVEAARSVPELAAQVQRVELVRHDLDLDYLSIEIPDAVTQSLGGIERVAEIVRALKGVAHPMADQLGSTDINQLIENTVLVARHEWRSVAEMRLDLDPDLPFVECVSGPVSQVILNLVVNAAHAIEERYGSSALDRGLIVVSSECVSGRVRIGVSDNGSGIAEEHRSRVFDPFFTTKEVGKGAGQGLSISYSVVVDQHSGTIQIDQGWVNGTRIVVELPIEHEAPEAQKLAEVA
jgi:signal transduction histidine kinase